MVRGDGGPPEATSGVQTGGPSSENVQRSLDTTGLLPGPRPTEPPKSTRRRRIGSRIMLAATRFPGVATGTIAAQGDPPVRERLHRSSEYPSSPVPPKMIKRSVTGSSTVSWAPRRDGAVRSFHLPFESARGWLGASINSRSRVRAMRAGLPGIIKLANNRRVMTESFAGGREGGHLAAEF